MLSSLILLAALVHAAVCENETKQEATDHGFIVAIFCMTLWTSAVVLIMFLTMICSKQYREQMQSMMMVPLQVGEEQD